MKGTLTLGFIFTLFFLQGQSSPNFCLVDSSQIIIPEINGANFVKESPDGGIIGMGYESQSNKAVIFKLAQDKQVLWSEITDLEMVTAANIHPDNGFLYLGAGNRLVKIDNFGNFVWSRRFDDEPLKSGRITKIQFTNNDNIRVLVSGTTFRINDEHKLGTTLLEFNALGELNWQNTYYNFYGAGMTTETEDGHFYLYGGSNVGMENQSNKPSIVIKLNSQGQTLLSKKLEYEGETNRYEERPIVINEDGGVFIGMKGAISGGSEFESILISLDDQLNVRWAKQWGMQPYLTAGRNLIGLEKSPLGGYIACVNERENRRVFLYHFDARGEVNWSTSYYHQSIQDDIELTVFRNGRVSYCGSWSNEGLIVITDERGDAGECGKEIAQGAHSELEASTSPHEIASIDLGHIITSTFISEENYPITTELLCTNQYPDLALQLLSATQCGNEVNMEVEICNNGIADFTQTSGIALYDKDPSKEGTQLVAAVPLSEEVPVDSCKKLQLQFTAGSIPERLFALVNNEENRGEKIDLAEESPLFLQKECRYLDNLDSIPIENPLTFSLGPDLALCREEEIKLSAGDRFVSYDWTAGPDFSCDECREITLFSKDDLEIIFRGETETGCIIRDTVFVKIVQRKLTQELRTICPGESTIVFGQEVNLEDVYEQTFLTAAGCDSTHRIKVKISESMELSFSSRSGCDGLDEGKITIDQLYGAAPISVLWPDLKSSAMEVDNLGPGTYALQITDGNGCRLDTLIDLQASGEAPRIRFIDPGPMRIDEGASALLDAVVEGGSGDYMLQWSPREGLSCVDCLSPLVQPRQNTTYVLTATDETGCWDRDSIIVEVEKNREVFVPNIFSPNGDGINDYFYVMTGAPLARIKTFRVFDRWGNLIVEKRDLPPNDEQLGWNGRYGDRELPSGTYVYFVEVDFGEGEVKKIMGEISLIR